MLQISIFTHFLLNVLFNNYTVLPDEDAYTQLGSQPVYHVLEAPQVSANATGQPNISKIKYGKILESLYSKIQIEEYSVILQLTKNARLLQ